MTDLRIGGLARLSACDWPGELVATVFCQGCPWDCPYCHNPQLRPARGGTDIPWAALLAFLETRRGLLDGVVFSGGEPTAQKALPDALRRVRALGFRVGLHTAGPRPERLAEVLPFIDWVGFDVKAPFAAYDRITRVAGSAAPALASLRHLMASGKTFEARTTVHPALLDDADLQRLRSDLAGLGIHDLKIQPFRPAGCADTALRDSPSIPRPAK